MADQIAHAFVSLTTAGTFPVAMGIYSAVLGFFIRRICDHIADQQNGVRDERAQQDSVGFTSTNAILMLGFMMFIGSLGNFLNGFLADKLGRKPVLGIYAYVGAMAAVVLAFSDGPASIVVAGAAAAFFGLGGFPTQKIYIAEQYPTRLRGFGTSVGEGVSRFLGGVLAAYYIPAILALGGTPAVFLFISGATALLVLPALLFGRETAGIDIDIAGHASATRISTVAGNRGEAWSNRLFGRLHGASTSPAAAPLIDSK